MARGGNPTSGPALTRVDQPVAAGPQDQAAAKQRMPKRLLPLLIAMTAIGPLSLNILVPAVPHLAVTWEADVNLVQLTLSLYMLGLAISQLVLGPLSDRFGRRPVIIAGLLLTTVSSALAVFASSIGGLIAARTTQSFGASTGLVIGRAIIRDLVGRERAASMYGLVTAAVVVPPMFGPLIGGILDTEFGWQAIFVFASAVSGLVLCWAIAALPETNAPATEKAERAHFWTDLRLFAGNRRFYGYVLTSMLTSAPYFAFTGGAPHVVVTLMGRTSAEYGIWFLTNSIGYMLGNFAASRLSMRFGIDTLIKWGLWFEVLVCIVSAALTEKYFDLGPGIPFVLQGVIYIGNGIVLPNAMAGAVSIRPQAAGTAAGISGFVQMGIGAAIAQFTGWVLIGASTALPMTLTMVAGTFAGVVAYYTLLGRPANR
jgi:DHA1 family bicyclomycin/chloramphenicol resistance-like MFS transporter